MELLTTHMEERLAARVRLLAERHQLSHAIILTGHRDLPAAARYLAAAMECTRILSCNSCRSPPRFTSSIKIISVAIKGSSLIIRL